MSVVDLAARTQCLPSGDEHGGDHLDHLGWDAIAATTFPVRPFPFKRASMALLNSLMVGPALSSSMTGRGMIE